ncbi:MAG: hypothetical protein M5U01_33800 [Ardenticatenaceae bacterium]|nr:hypothetical protein [Ardenticatenaceae bacterium]
MDLNIPFQRLEQQLAAFERMHAGELTELHEKLAAYQRLHADEVRFLREELEQLKQQVHASLVAVAPPPSGPVQTERPRAFEERGL